MSEAPRTTWRVESQAPATEAVNGAVVDGYRIYFTTGQGHPGNVFVPMRQYNPDHVKQVIGDAATNADAVGALSSDDTD